MRNNPHSYLAGIMSGNVSKAKDVAARVTVKAHSRARPGPGVDATVNDPNGRPNPAMKSGSIGQRTSQNSPGAATAKARAPKHDPASSSNIEGNESAMYERYEKKSLKSLKGGGTEKELREGHNTHGKSMKPGGGGRFAKMEEAIERTGKSEASAKAIAASAGRAKYGKKKFQAMAAKGRARAAK